MIDNFTALARLTDCLVEIKTQDGEIFQAYINTDKIDMEVFKNLRDFEIKKYRFNVEKVEDKEITLDDISTITRIKR